MSRLLDVIWTFGCFLLFCSATVAEEIPKSIVSPASGAKLLLIPAGDFLMGSPTDDADAPFHSRPAHAVTISRPFYLGATEITQGQWKRVMQTEPWLRQGKGGFFKEGDEYPVSNISWKEAAEFCAKLSQAEKRTYRLPTEAEWEYAARAGQTTKWVNADTLEELAETEWVGEVAIARHELYPHRVAQKKANPWGLCDMGGNISEYCSDWFDPKFYSTSPKVDPRGPAEGSRRVVRGGAWCTEASWARPAFRTSCELDLVFAAGGLRIACDAVDEKPTDASP